MHWGKVDVDNSIKKPYFLIKNKKIKTTNDCLLRTLGTVMLIIITAVVCSNSFCMVHSTVSYGLILMYPMK